MGAWWNDVVDGCSTAIEEENDKFGCGSAVETTKKTLGDVESGGQRELS